MIQDIRQWRQIQEVVVMHQKTLGGGKKRPDIRPTSYEYTSIPTGVELSTLHEERQETAYISNLLRNQPFDEWAEWRTNVTKLLMIPEEEEVQHRPVTPMNSHQDSVQTAQRSPGRRKSLFNFAKATTKAVLSKRRSVIW